MEIVQYTSKEMYMTNMMYHFRLLRNNHVFFNGIQRGGYHELDVTTMRIN